MAPHSHTASMAVDERPGGRAEEGDVAAGADAPGLEGGGHGPGVVEEGTPGDDVLGAAGDEGERAGAGIGRRPPRCARAG